MKKILDFPLKMQKEKRTQHLKNSRSKKVTKTTLEEHFWRGTQHTKQCF